MSNIATLQWKRLYFSEKLAEPHCIFALYNLPPSGCSVAVSEPVLEREGAELFTIILWLIMLTWTLLTFV